MCYYIVHDMCPMIGGLSIRSRSMEQNCALGDNSWYVWRILCATTSCMIYICVLMTMCYMHAVHQAIWRVTLMWILYLWLPQVLRRIQPQLAATQKIFGMVEKAKDGQNNHQSNNSWHLQVCYRRMLFCWHRKFFNDESDLATEPKYKSLRNWRTDLNMNDYKLPGLFWFLWTCFICELWTLWM